MNRDLPPQASVVDVGWGRLLFAHTFPDAPSLARAVLNEKQNKRDIAFYVIDPQLILNEAPQELFLDPSTTYRLDLKAWEHKPVTDVPFEIGTIERESDIEEINRIYLSQNMVPLDPDVIWRDRENESYDYFVARPSDSERILGVALAVDHTRCFDDLMNSSSLWALAVDPQIEYPAVGVTLVNHIANTMKSQGRELLDLSVLQDNEAAIGLYEQLGFERVPVFAIKCRNQINEALFVPQHPQEGYNPYATIIINEALRRSIMVEPLDLERGFFRLSLGNRRVTCRESLSDLTSAIAMCRCADKQLTRELLDNVNLSVPAQVVAFDPNMVNDFLSEHRSVVVKPADGEQGQGVAVDLRTPEEVERAIAAAKKFDETVLLEEYIEGLDLRVIVINFEVVAAAVRKPPVIVGDGRYSAKKLIERVSRRRSAATGGESNIPLDEETERCVKAAGFAMDDIVPEGQSITVRRTANLHTGGTIHDVTSELGVTIQNAAVEAAKALEIPVVGLDFLTPDVAGDRYVIIEANERPGLANHEPQPTAERFIDLLFPHTRIQSLEG